MALTWTLTPLQSTSGDEVRLPNGDFVRLSKLKGRIDKLVVKTDDLCNYLRPSRMERPLTNLFGQLLLASVHTQLKDECQRAVSRFLLGGASNSPYYSADFLPHLDKLNEYYVAFVHTFYMAVTVEKNTKNTHRRLNIPSLVPSVATASDCQDRPTGGERGRLLAAEVLSRDRVRNRSSLGIDAESSVATDDDVGRSGYTCTVVLTFSVKPICSSSSSSNSVDIGTGTGLEFGSGESGHSSSSSSSAPAVTCTPTMYIIREIRMYAQTAVGERKLVKAYNFDSTPTTHSTLGSNRICVTSGGRNVKIGLKVTLPPLLPRRGGCITPALMDHQDSTASSSTSSRGSSHKNGENVNTKQKRKQKQSRVNDLLDGDDDGGGMGIFHDFSSIRTPAQTTHTNADNVSTSENANFSSSSPPALRESPDLQETQGSSPHASPSSAHSTASPYLSPYSKTDSTSPANGVSSSTSYLLSLNSSNVLAPPRVAALFGECTFSAVTADSRSCSTGGGRSFRIGNSVLGKRRISGCDGSDGLPKIRGVPDAPDATDVVAFDIRLFRDDVSLS